MVATARNRLSLSLSTRYTCCAVCRLSRNLVGAFTRSEPDPVVGGPKSSSRYVQFTRGKAIPERASGPFMQRRSLTSLAARTLCSCSISLSTSWP